MTTAEIENTVREEALAARRALPALTDERATEALRRLAALIRERAGALIEASGEDVGQAKGRLDAGTLDRLRLDEPRVEALAVQAEALAELPPLERLAGERLLANGLRIQERRIPIGVVGANFEARPNVALDVAGQLLKSLNAGVLRTGGAALRTVTLLVDSTVRPALEAAGIPGAAVGLVRSAGHEGARALVTLPRELPLVILRGSGETTAQLARLAAEHGVRTLAHAEGGGVLYLHASADAAKALALTEASLDRLGVCNRLNLLLIDRQQTGLLPELLTLFARLGLTVRGSERARALSSAIKPLEQRLGHEWASDPDEVETVTVELVESLEQAAELANEETSGLAAGVVAEDAAAAERFLDAYRGTAAFWHAPTRFTDGYELTGAPETGINVDWTPGPRGPVTYRDLWLRQYRIVGDGTQRR